MTIYYKATRPDGWDFHTGKTINCRNAIGGVVVAPSHERDTYACCTDQVLHASDVPTETLVGGSWPCALFEVEGDPVADDGHKRGFRELRVVREIDPHLALGPQGVYVAELIRVAGELTADQLRTLAGYATRSAARYAAGSAARDAARSAARSVAWSAAWYAAGSAARDAARSAAGDAAGSAARDAARSVAWSAAWSAARYAAFQSATFWSAADAATVLIVRDLIGQHGFTQAHYDTLTQPWRDAVGPIHPEDAS